MSIAPLITFKAGLCEYDVSQKNDSSRVKLTKQDSTGKVRPQPEKGYIYLYPADDDLLHFCWRKRSTHLEEPEMDLIMFPQDGSFVPLEKTEVNGRIFVLKFASSSARYLFWLQSKSQSPTDDPSYFGPRDLKIGDLVNSLLQNEEVDVPQAVAEMKAGHPPDDDDTTMEDVEGHGSTRHGTRTSRNPGEGAREGGADGGRA